MTNEERKELIQKVVDRHVAMSCVFDDLMRIVGECVESPLWEEVWATADLLIESVSELIGDDNASLNWYINENGCGAKLLEAGVNGDMRRIGTVEDLLWLIDMEATAQSR